MEIPQTFLGPSQFSVELGNSRVPKCFGSLVFLVWEVGLDGILSVNLRSITEILAILLKEPGALDPTLIHYYLELLVGHVNVVLEAISACIRHDLGFLLAAITDLDPVCMFAVSFPHTRNIKGSIG